MYCSKCGKKVSDSITVCPGCGTTEFTEQRRVANFHGMPAIWMLISFAFNLCLGIGYFYIGLLGMNPNLQFKFSAPFLSFTVDSTGEFNVALAFIGFIIILYSLVYLVLLATKKQYLYGVLMVAAIMIASFDFFFYGGSLAAIIMIPIMLIFPSITKMLIGKEWDYMA